MITAAILTQEQTLQSTVQGSISFGAGSLPAQAIDVGLAKLDP
jgi:hypothetical protein